MAEYEIDLPKKEYVFTVHKPKTSLLKNLQKDSEETA